MLQAVVEVLQEYPEGYSEFLDGLESPGNRKKYRGLNHMKSII